MSEETKFKENMRYAEWFANMFEMENKIKEFLSHCGNMTGEDDMRDLCDDAECPLYHYCISIEPAEEE